MKKLQNAFNEELKRVKVTKKSIAEEGVSLRGVYKFFGRETSTKRSASIVFMRAILLGVFNQRLKGEFILFCVNICCRFIGQPAMTMGELKRVLCAGEKPAQRT